MKLLLKADIIYCGVIEGISEKHVITGRWKMAVAEAISINSLLDESIIQYSEMREVLTEIKCRLDGSAVGHITLLLDRFNQLGEDARVLDLQLARQFDSFDQSVHVTRKVEQKKNLQADILTLIAQTVPKAENVKSILAGEIQSIRRGRNAMSGYKSGSLNQGCIVNKSS